MAANTNTHQVSWWLRDNRYAGTCMICNTEVPAHAGYCQKDSTTGKWLTVCDGCAHEHGRVVPDVYLYNGQVRQATAKSVATGRGHDVCRCCRCDAQVALVKGKAGKWYLASVLPKVKDDPDSADGLRVYDFRPHDCDAVLALRDERRAAVAAEDLKYRLENDEQLQALRQDFFQATDPQVELDQARVRELLLAIKAREAELKGA